MKNLTMQAQSMGYSANFRNNDYQGNSYLKQYSGSFSSFSQGSSARSGFPAFGVGLSLSGKTGMFGGTSFPFSSAGQGTSSAAGMEKYRTTKSAKNENLREMIRSLDRTATPGTNPYSASPLNKENGLLGTSSSKDDDEEEEKPVNYNYREVSTQIQRAKTSINAGQAVIKAKRKVLELKRKLAASDGENEEVMIALEHAKRMERVARKKKRHLELEEMVAATQERDARNKQEEGGEGSSGVKYDLIDIAEQRLSDAQFEIDEEQEEKLKELEAEFSDLADTNNREISDNTDIPDEMLSEMAELLEESSATAQEMLEEALSALEDLAAVDPHMSKEDFQKLVMKHRNSERKDIVKADMDYLKDMIAHYEKKGSDALPGFGGGNTAMPAAPVFFGSTPMVSAAELVMSSIDVQM